MVLVRKDGRLYMRFWGGSFVEVRDVPYFGVMLEGMRISGVDSAKCALLLLLWAEVMEPTIRYDALKVQRAIEFGG
jgi:hypothetical protein